MPAVASDEHGVKGNAAFLVRGVARVQAMRLPSRRVSIGTGTLRNSRTRT